jgi:hypothetical protein
MPDNYSQTNYNSIYADERDIRQWKNCLVVAEKQPNADGIYKTGKILAIRNFGK